MGTAACSPCCIATKQTSRFLIFLLDKSHSKPLPTDDGSGKVGGGTSNGGTSVKIKTTQGKHISVISV